MSRKAAIQEFGRIGTFFMVRRRKMRTLVLFSFFIQSVPAFLPMVFPGPHDRGVRFRRIRGSAVCRSAVRWHGMRYFAMIPFLGSISCGFLGWSRALEKFRIGFAGVCLGLSAFFLGVDTGFFQNTTKHQFLSSSFSSTTRNPCGHHLAGLPSGNVFPRHGIRNRRGDRNPLAAPTPDMAPRAFEPQPGISDRRARRDHGRIPGIFRHHGTGNSRGEAVSPEIAGGRERRVSEQERDQYVFRAPLRDHRIRDSHTVGCGTRGISSRSRCRRAARFLYGTDAHYDDLDDYGRRQARGPFAHPPRHIFIVLGESYDSCRSSTISFAWSHGNLREFARDGIYFPIFSPHRTLPSCHSRPS